jgi:hypothetical protein
MYVCLLHKKFLNSVGAKRGSFHDSIQSISIKDFVREKKIRNRKKKEQQKFLMKFNTKPLKFKYGMGEGGRAGQPMQGMGTPT